MTKRHIPIWLLNFSVKALAHMATKNQQGHSFPSVHMTINTLNLKLKGHPGYLKTTHDVTFSTFRPSSLTTARDWAANASLISNKSTWSSCQPAFSTYRGRNESNVKHEEGFSQLLLCLGAFQISHRFPDGRYWSSSHDGRIEANLSRRYNSGHGFDATPLRL